MLKILPSDTTDTLIYDLKSEKLFKLQTSLKNKTQPSLKGNGYTCEIFGNFFKGRYFGICLFASLYTRSLWKRAYSKRKEFVPHGPSIFTLEQTPTDKGGKNILTKLPPLQMYPFLLNISFGKPWFIL